jgi:uncharacterized SAM-binding protein YcdF (DUF218 family)
VCDHACELIGRGISDKLVLSGNTGHWTGMLWNRPEARVFLERARSRGIDEHLIVLEERATNIGENIAKSKALVPDAKSVTFVTKPNTLLRVKLAVPVQWPEVRAYTSCPCIAFPDGVSNIVGLFGLIHEMVGDVERILEYPKLGYQVEHEFPSEVLESWEYLKQQGFTQHLMRNS